MPRPTHAPDPHARQESLQHLGWPLVCLQLAEHLRTPMALARLEAELDQHDRGGGGLLGAEDYAASIAGRSADADAVSLRFREQDGLAAMLAVQASAGTRGPAPEMRASAPGGSQNLADALSRTSDLLDVSLRAGRNLTLTAAEMYAALQQLLAAGLCVDLHAAVRAERGYADDPGVPAIGARHGSVEPLEGRVLLSAAADAVANRVLDPSSLYTHRYTLEQLAEALNATRDRPEGFMKALVTMQSDGSSGA